MKPEHTYRRMVRDQEIFDLKQTERSKLDLIKFKAIELEFKRYQEVWESKAYNFHTNKLNVNNK